MGLSSRLVGLFALLPPVLALGGTWAALSTYEEGPATSREWKELLNAGTVVNGVKRKEGAVAYMESQLAKSQPKVLILGNSYANTNLAPMQISYALGIQPGKVLTMSVPNSVSSHWYAILQHRVYDQGYQVPLILIVGGLQSLLMYEPYSEASYEDLMVQLDAREPVLGRYIDLSHPELRKLARNRVLFRDVGLNTLRDTALDLFFTGGTEAHTAALEKLFSDENMDMSRHTIPGMDEESIEGLPTPAESMIEDLARMVQANGSTLVYVRTPLLARTPEEKSDKVPEQTLHEVEAIFMRYGHVFLNLYDLELPVAAYKNAAHLSPEGARLFTVEVNKTLVEVWGEDHRPERFKEINVEELGGAVGGRRRGR